ncbi:MAG: glycosyltransferase family 39 protein, partial [Phycisphaerae bacterium]|nr:glycosyltransferase family 39 protein [Phycisphaerae bacterium]
MAEPLRGAVVPESFAFLPPAELPLATDVARDQRRYGWTAAVVSILLIRAIVFLVGVWSIQTVTSPDQIDHINASGTPWIAFDGGFYLSIFLHGYPPGPAVPFHIAYFPLYPYAARLLSPLFSASTCLLIVSNVCSIIGLLVVYAWAKSITKVRTAFISAVLLAAYPGAAFYCADMTEGMFMMLVAIVMFLLTQQRLYTAALVCAVATACRPTAVALSVTVVVWTILNSREFPIKVQLRRVILIGMLSIMGGACYEGFLWHRYGRIDAYKVSEDKWEHLDVHIMPATDREALEKVREDWISSTLAPQLREAKPASSELFPTSHRQEPPPRSWKFFESKLTTSQAWNRLIIFALLLVLAGAIVKRSAVPRLLLLVP